jgi:predicted DCC family thiol-disulfide oxidoreductase YuxK
MVSADPDAASSDLLAVLPPRVVFFDGVCGFCDRTVRMLLDRDVDRRLHFATLQGETARALARRYPDDFPDDVDSLVYLDNTAAVPRFLVRSQASFAIAREVPSLRRWAWLSLLPGFLTDLGYRLLAAVRYRVFGRLDACRIPAPEDRARFLA